MFVSLWQNYFLLIHIANICQYLLIYLKYDKSTLTITSSIYKTHHIIYPITHPSRPHPPPPPTHSLQHTKYSKPSFIPFIPNPILKLTHIVYSPFPFSQLNRISTILKSIMFYFRRFFIKQQFFPYIAISILFYCFSFVDWAYMIILILSFSVFESV